MECSPVTRQSTCLLLAAFYGSHISAPTAASPALAKLLQNNVKWKAQSHSGSHTASERASGRAALGGLAWALAHTAASADDVSFPSAATLFAGRLPPRHRHAHSLCIHSTRRRSRSCSRGWSRSRSGSLCRRRCCCFGFLAAIEFEIHSQLKPNDAITKRAF